jgi:hypothetical protein
VLSASIIKARASRLLTKKQDSQVFGVRATRVAVRVFLMLYVSAVFIILAFLGVNVRLGTYVSYLVGAGLVVWAHVTYFRSLRALNLPAAYVSAIGRARMVMYLGFAAILGIVEMGRP